MGENEKRTRGRPRVLQARRNRINVRLSDRELGWVHQIAETYDISVNEAMRIALDYYFRNVF